MNRIKNDRRWEQKFRKKWNTAYLYLTFEPGSSKQPSSNPIRASRGSHRTAHEAERQSEPPLCPSRLAGTWPKRFIRFGDPETNGILLQRAERVREACRVGETQEQWPEEVIDQHGGRGKDLGKRGPDQTSEVYEPRTSQCGIPSACSRQAQQWYGNYWRLVLQVLSAGDENFDRCIVIESPGNSR
jgi:hypothetical protein